MVFTITFNTLQYRPDILITLRTSNNWDKNIPGLYVIAFGGCCNPMNRYEGDGWNFELDVRDFPNGIRFKFVLQRSTWMNGNDIYIGNVNDGARCILIYAYLLQQFILVVCALIPNIYIWE